MFSDLPPDCLEVERVNISIKNINLNSLNILSKLEPRSTRTLEGKMGGGNILSKLEPRSTRTLEGKMGGGNILSKLEPRSTRTLDGKMGGGKGRGVDGIRGA